MSTSTSLNLRDITIERLKGSLERYNKDVRHFTDEQFAASPGGEARSAQAITTEVGLFNDMCAKVISGEPVPEVSEEAMGKAMADFNTREKVIGIFASGTAALEKAIAEISDEEFQSEVTAPWGQPVTKQYLANACSMHMDYHDGQLNIIQCMNGDTSVHWMDE